MKIELFDGIIAFHRSFVKPAGGVKAALFMSQVLYWNNRTSDKNGWFYKTYEEFEEETGLTRKNQETARRQLVEINWLVTKIKSVNNRPIAHFQIGAGFIAWLRQNTGQNSGEGAYAQTGQKPPSPLTPESGVSKRPDGAALLETETTTEITEENTPLPPTGGGVPPAGLLVTPTAIPAPSRPKDEIARKVEAIATRYNLVAEKLKFPKCRLPLSAPRAAKVAARLKAYPEKVHWDNMLAALEQSTELVGQSWFTGIDWIVQNDISFEKVSRRWMSFRNECKTPPGSAPQEENGAVARFVSKQVSFKLKG